MINKHQLEGTGKLRELVLYICLRSEGDESFGSVKLNKELFFSDFTAYLSTGRAITGHDYQKLENGPAPRVMKPLLDDMIERGDLVLATRDYHGYSQKKPLALREPDLAEFTGKEIAIVGEILDQYRHFSARDISDLSHEFIGWQAVEEGETIPYASVLLDSRELSEQDHEWVKTIDTSRIEELLAS